MCFESVANVLRPRSRANKHILAPSNNTKIQPPQKTKTYRAGDFFLKKYRCGRHWLRGLCGNVGVGGGGGGGGGGGRQGGILSCIASAAHLRIHVRRMILYIYIYIYIYINAVYYLYIVVHMFYTCS
jgi:hypothetical protein